MTESCESCRFYHQRLRCRRYPPTPMAMSESHQGRWSRVGYAWPQTKSSDWCGEWKGVATAQGSKLRPIRSRMAEATP